MGFLVALQFLTRVPVVITRPLDDRAIARSMLYFSLIGLLIGGAAAGVHYLLYQTLSPTLANLGAIVFIIFVTGNLHGDGLMDTADGIFSGRPREKMLEIMRDSRVGSHGVMAGVLVVLLKVMLLGEMEQTMQMTALVLVPTLGRWAQVYGAARYPYARSEGTGLFTSHVGWRELVACSIVVLVAAVLLLQVSALALLVLLFAGTVMFHSFIKRRLGGITGDTLGAANEFIEVLTFLVIAIMFLIIS